MENATNQNLWRGVRQHARTQSVAEIYLGKENAMVWSSVVEEVNSLAENVGEPANFARLRQTKNLEG